MLVKPPPNRNITGGTKVYTIYSGGTGVTGVTDSISLWSGAGVVNSILMLDLLTSGKATAVVDCAPGNVVSGLDGFLGSSGYSIIGIGVPTFNRGVNSGFQPPNVIQMHTPIAVGLPFYSGLAVNAVSGANPCTISYTPLPIPV